MSHHNRHHPRASSKTFDSDVKKKGRQAAIDAAVAGGAKLSSRGRRIKFPGGGSRLTDRPGLNR